MRYALLLVLGLTTGLGIQELPGAGEPPMMEDLSNPADTGRVVTLIHRFGIDPVLLEDIPAVLDYAAAVKANDAVGLKELSDKGKCREGKVGTTALILERFGDPVPGAKIRIASGPEKDRIVYVIATNYETMVPTRVRAGETGVLANMDIRSVLASQTPDSQVNMYHTIGDYKEYREEDVKTIDRSGPYIGGGGITIDKFDDAYIRRGKLIVLPAGVRAKVLEFVSPADNPTQTLTLARVEVEIAHAKVIKGKKIQKVTGYVLAFNVYKDEEGRAKRKGAK